MIRHLWDAAGVSRKVPVAVVFDVVRLLPPSDGGVGQTSCGHRKGLRPLAAASSAVYGAVTLSGDGFDRRAAEVLPGRWVGASTSRYGTLQCDLPEECNRYE